MERDIDFPPHLAKRNHMRVVVNGVERERPVVAVSNLWNGYKHLQIPYVESGESLHWVVGSRVPHIEGFAHA